MRRAQSHRKALMRWLRPLGTAVLVTVVVSAWYSHPAPGTHGASLAVSIAIGAIVVPGLILLSITIRTNALTVCLLGVLVAGSAALLWVQPDGPGLIGVCVMVGSAARALNTRLSLLLTAAALAFVAIAGIVLGGRESSSMVVSEPVLIVVWMTALVARRLRASDERMEELLVELEETREAQAQAVALAERQRLAREMHDVLAHSLSGLMLHLEGARLLATTTESDPRVAAAIGNAHQLAKSGLEEARQALGMLRDDQLPGPDRLTDLTNAFERDSGVPCHFEVHGAPRTLNPQTRLALYRVTQEALTNIRKHARPERVEVRLDYQDDATLLRVEDFGGTAPPEPAPASGYGLTGMRERAELIGGTLTAGRPDENADTGFRVELRVPA